MIDERIFSLPIKRLYCPACGNWHDWEGDPLAEHNESWPYRYKCNGFPFTLYIKENSIFHFDLGNFCSKFTWANRFFFDAKFDQLDVEVDKTNPIIKIPFKFDHFVRKDFDCSLCKRERDRYCNFSKNTCSFMFQIEFDDRKSFDKYAESIRKEQFKEDDQQHQSELTMQHEEENNHNQELKKQPDEESKCQQDLKKQHDKKTQNHQELERPNIEKIKSPKTTNQVKDDNAMNKKSTEKTTIKQQLWEHAPKENFKIVKQWAEKYKPTLKCAIPVVTIYVAYRILNFKNSGPSADK